MPEEESGKEREEPARQEAGPPVRQRGLFWLSLALALVLLLVLSGVGSSPYWAPFLMPFLPWSAKPTASPDRVAALAASVRALEVRMNREFAHLTSRVEGASERLRSLAADVHRSRENAARIAALQKRLAKGVSAPATPPSKAPPAAPHANRAAPAPQAASARVGEFNKRLAAFQKKWEEKAAAEDAAITKIERDVARIDAVTASLADRVPQLAKELGARLGARRNEAGIFLALIEMREAVDAGRPFKDSYEALMARIHERPRLRRDPEIAASAAMLAPLAEEGVPSLAALAQRLGTLSPRKVAQKAPKASSWAERIAAHLRSLVRIRRTGTRPEPALEKAIATARHDLSRSDLKGAVAALEPLRGAPAVKAWVAAAEGRLRADSALHRLRDLLVAEISAAIPASAPAAFGSGSALPTTSPPGANPGKPG